ncbi:hypothetical protein [Actinomadura fibrosa]|uniref:ABC transporter substrate-binding protein n=1 Tax=Actinomadura fibrosa TaxID=111802 RepID=A0ABW2XTG1_9ACTN|nr:hypothetical protein [Actinomadura fibrosa]
MKRVLIHLSALTVAVLTALAFSIVPASAAPRAAAPAPLDSVPVSGTTEDGSTFTGTVVPTAFTSQGRQVLVNGDLTGTLRDSSGTTTEVTRTPVSLPVALPAATCPILHLTLGPLDLNLLGLTVHLDRVVLDITAISGPGNLLGNLLCAIAGLLDGTGDLSGLAALLAQLNALLGLGNR